jgi:hypothetical protein
MFPCDHIHHETMNYEFSQWLLENIGKDKCQLMVPQQIEMNQILHHNPHRPQDTLRPYQNDLLQHRPQDLQQHSNDLERSFNITKRVSRQSNVKFRKSK